MHGPRFAYPLLIVGLLLLPTLIGGCTSSPQIVSVSPAPGNYQTSTQAPLRIVFDQPMDQGSVASHFHLEPSTSGVTISWPNSKTALISHALFSTTTEYQAILEGGYRDLEGSSNSLRHHWQFKTENSPTLNSST
ncbi:MAG: Ig-like domain-containing protein, partial [Candidatus Dormibacteraceae bacterium]